MRRALRVAFAAVLAGGAVHAQVQVDPVPIQIAPARPVQVAPPAIGGGIAVPARVVEYTGPTPTQKAVNSQLVVSGKVSIAKETVDAPMYQGVPAKTTFTVATITVDDTLIGDKTDSVKVLVGPGDPAQIPYEPPGQPQVYNPQFPNQIQLIDGQEGVFFLQPHPTVDDSYMVSPGNPPLNPLDATYKSDVAEVKQVAAVYADPVKALKVDDADARLRAVSVLLNKYNRYPTNFRGPGQPKQVAIPDDETKLIFDTLISADWAKWDQPQQGPVDYTLNPRNMFYQLRIPQGNQPGAFPQVRGNSAAFQEALKEWRKDAGKDFQIKRFVQPGEKK